MKKKLVQTRIILSCMVVCEILIFSCQKRYEDLNLEEKQEKEVKRISIDEMKIKIGNSKDFENLSKLFDFKVFNNIYSSKNDNSIYLDTNEIVMIEKDETVTYTFLIRGYPSENFFNLAVDFDRNGNIISSSIINYEPSLGWELDRSMPFTGTAKIIKNDLFDEKNIKQTLGLNRSNWCVVGASGQWECNYGNNHYPNQPATDCTSWDYIITYTWGFCEQSITSNTIEVGGAGTESEEVEGGGGSPTVPVIPDEDCDTKADDLKKVFKDINDNTAKLLANIINKKGSDFGINTKEDLWHFLAQAGHETGGFGNLNVSENTTWTTASKLAETYSRFTMDSTKARSNKNLFYAPHYLRNPSGVANVAMCCKFGNGDASSGDGYKYRGRGIFQLTWKDNYKDFKNWYNSKYNPDIDPVSNPNIISSNDTLAILSGLWYYKVRVDDKINVDSTTTVDDVTLKINAKKKGLKDRKERFKTIKDLIKCI